MAGLCGFYINLDRSPRRRRAMSNALARAGLTRTHRRFPATDGLTLKDVPDGISPGERGCFLSHLGALQAGQAEGGHVHIVEDDVVFCEGFAGCLAALAGSAINDFDILFTDMWTPVEPAFTGPALAMVADFAATGAFGLIGDTFLACLSSYVVNARSVARLTSLLRREIERGPARPVDLCIAGLVAAGELRVGCVFPYITSILLSEIGQTTIARPDDLISERIIKEAVRAGYFVNANIPALKRTVVEQHVGDIGLHGYRLSVLTILDEIARRRTQAGAGM